MSNALNISRREFLQRCAAVALLVYAAPALQLISMAHATSGSGSGGGGGGSNSGSGGGSTSGSGSDSSGSGSETGTSSGSGPSVSSSEAREAVKSGAAAPLKDILAIVRKKYKGEIVRVNLAKSSNRLVYNIRMIDTDNRLLEIRISARSGRIISAKGK